jgi:hypothetical protein
MCGQRIPLPDPGMSAFHATAMMHASMVNYNASGLVTAVHAEFITPKTEIDGSTQD